MNRSTLPPVQFAQSDVYGQPVHQDVFFDVSMPKVVAKVLEEIGVHGNLIAAISAELQGLRGSADFEACRYHTFPVW